MGQDETEVQEITSFCQATLLNLGVLDENRICVGVLAGRKANELGHPVVLDPVGAGASLFRRKAIDLIRKRMEVSLIRCNQEEACALLDMERGATGGVESGVVLTEAEQLNLADLLAGVYECTVMISGEADAVSDGERRMLLTGGDRRMARLTGSGCMLSALCALFCGAGLAPYEAACAAGSIWKESAWIAGRRTDRMQGGIGSFRVHLFDAVDQLCHGVKCREDQERRGGRMRMDRKRLRLYAVTDRSWLRPGERLTEPVETLLQAGVTCVQLREKHLGDEVFLEEAKALKELCGRYQVPLIINDRPDIAQRAGADGVHVGLSDMGIRRARALLGEGYIIGGSAHNVQEALAAQEAGADYIGCGAVFGSSTKTDATVLPYEELKAICRAVEIPVVAIGGIHRGNVKKLAGSGIDGIAVISALFAGEDKGAAAKELLGAWEGENEDSIDHCRE